MIQNSPKILKDFTFGSVLRIGAPKIHFCKMLNRLSGRSQSAVTENRKGVEDRSSLYFPMQGWLFYVGSLVVFTAETSSTIAQYT
jgi:hypothetical protein